MTDTLLVLRNKIPENLKMILKSVFAALDNTEIKAFVVGATARDLIFEYVYGANIRRKTEDVDFGVAVETWAEYARLKDALILTGKFKDDSKNEQRIWWKEPGEEMKIDLVPFGGVESPAGQIAFPPRGDFVMSTIGFEEAFKNACHLQITDDLNIKIASLAGLVVLKFVAYHDRPHARKRDVQDIFFIAQNYLKADNEERLYDQTKDGDLLSDDFDYATAGARMLGRDTRKLLSQETGNLMTLLLAEEEDGGSLQKFVDIISENEFDDEKRYKFIFETFRQIRTGLLEK